VKQKDKEGDSKLVYSMDVPEVYGPVASKLSFAEAVRLKIVCDYKVIISVVTSEMITNKMLSQGEVLVSGDPVKARQVANQLALQMAAEKHGVSKIFTFHRSVASAQSFTRQGSEGITAHLSDFTAFHVNGEMPTSRREEFMTAFRDAPKALISNARCLTEGVDVPAVDMVAFMSPKRSRVDIVQAAGRAMRRKEGKECGYILIPLFVEHEKGETLEQALARAEFEEVWDVLQAMQEQDDVLAETIRQMREDYGKRKGYDDFRFRKKVEVLGQKLSIDLLRESITTKCIERLGTTWDERYGELKIFKESFNHCNVPRDWPENLQLGTWVSTQRRAKKQNNLSPERIKMLDALGFPWDPFGETWDDMFNELKEYKKQYGHTNVPAKLSKNKKLEGWVRTQRQLKKQNRLADERINQLEKIGFVWEPFDSAWEEMFGEMIKFRQQYGNTNIPKRWPDNLQLGMWAQNQRRLKKQGKLSLERIKRLDELGFAWDPLEADWQQMFSVLNKFHEKYGHSNVPKRWPDNPRLGSWVSERRKDKMYKNKLSPERIKMLDAIGFVWDPIGETWDEMFNELKEYKNQYGHTNVPANRSKNKKLGRWVSTQRQLKKQNSLDSDRIHQLEEIGFAWEPFDSYWENMFTALKSYQLECGNCKVPAKWAQNPQLGHWVVNQRRSKEKNILSPDRLQRLDAIGFVWDPLEANWQEMFSDLNKFHEKYGHSNVTLKWPDNLSLGIWVRKQIMLKRQGKLSPERIKRLDELGFVWDPLEADWEKMFKELNKYHEKYGNSNVPKRWSDNLQLGSWVSTQRRMKNQNKLSVDRIHRLNHLGFCWDALEDNWERMFSDLKKYRQQFGNCNVPAKWPKNIQLGSWVNTQRYARKKNKLGKERIGRLNELGFDWRMGASLIK